MVATEGDMSVLFKLVHGKVMVLLGTYFDVSILAINSDSANQTKLTETFETFETKPPRRGNVIHSAMPKIILQIEETNVSFTKNHT